MDPGYKSRKATTEALERPKNSVTRVGHNEYIEHTLLSHILKKYDKLN